MNSMHPASVDCTVSSIARRVDAHARTAGAALAAIVEHGYTATALRYGVEGAVAHLARAYAGGVPVVIAGTSPSMRELARALGVVDLSPGAVTCLRDDGRPTTRLVQALLAVQSAAGHVHGVVLLTDDGEGVQVI